MLQKFAFAARASNDRGRYSSFRRRVTWSQVALVLAVLAIGGCRNGDLDYYPLATGRWWIYEVTTSVRGEPGRHRLIVENLRSDGAAVLQRRQNRLLSRLYTGPRGITLSKSHADSKIEQLIFPASPRPGLTWSVSSELALVESRTFAAEDKLQGRHLPLTLTARVVDRHRVITTAAGLFNECLEIELTGKRIVRIDRGNAYAEVVVTQQEWYAPEIGLVKVSRTEQANSTFLRDGSYVQELIEFGE